MSAIGLGVTALGGLVYAVFYRRAGAAAGRRVARPAASQAEADAAPRAVRQCAEPSVKSRHVRGRSS